MSFNIEVQGGKNYLLPTGGKYCPQDIEIAAIGGQTEGMYCWAKLDKKPELPVGYTRLESLTTTGVEYFDSGYIINPTTYRSLKVVADVAIALPTTSVYYLSGHGGAQPLVYLGITNSKRYGYANGTTDVATSVTADGNRHLWTLDYKNGKFKVDNVVDVTFSPQNITASANFYISAYNMSGTATNKHIEQIYSWEFYENNILIKRLVPCLDSSGVCCLYDTVGKGTVYAIDGTPTAGTNLGKVKADGYTLSDDLNAYPQDGYGEDGFYYKRLMDNIPWHEAGSYVWAKSDANGNLISYVVSDDSSEFPEDGQGDDGYYYKLQEMGVSFKYASGSGSTPSSSYDGASFVVSGVAFRPKTLFLSWNATGQVNNTIVADLNGTIKQVNSYNGSTIAITDDGFTFFTNSGLYPSNTLSYSWMATGV